ncbi:hypothetical protein JM946_18625 [Steroidobacter sp. S1-65]|uniref:MxaA protein n=1 Tax=Steroidobacter gossypii TaxID=2805490 RepID=A0ABS1X0N2_9GAMM|nr:hypothetical protein [Steroidobacter gossypii]MBM0106752.1 hypothetical protein [Steroidobacter gossypii]
MAVAAADTLAASQVTTAVVEQPRPFGYVVGDLVTQRVLLTSAAVNFDPATLPPVQRVNIWFERRSARIEPAPDGKRWLIVNYQLINAPPALATVNLPAWELEDQAGVAKLRIPAAPISVAPLISHSASPTASDLRPDRQVSMLDTTPTRTRLLACSLALGVTLIAWLAWWQWRNWRDSLGRPFARALHELRRMEDGAPEAWQALHRAFDQTAGRVLQIETLPTLFERAPQLQPRRAEIERFFADSNERFFGAGPPSNALSLRALCQDLRRIERRHAS